MKVITQKETKTTTKYYVDVETKKKIKQYCQENNLTQKDLAKKLGISTYYMYSIVAGNMSVSPKLYEKFKQIGLSDI